MTDQAADEPPSPSTGDNGAQWAESLRRLADQVERLESERAQHKLVLAEVGQALEALKVAGLDASRVVDSRIGALERTLEATDAKGIQSRFDQLHNQIFTLYSTYESKFTRDVQLRVTISGIFVTVLMVISGLFGYFYTDRSIARIETQLLDARRDAELTREQLNDARRGTETLAAQIAVSSVQTASLQASSNEFAVTSKLLSHAQSELNTLVRTVSDSEFGLRARVAALAESIARVEATSVSTDARIAHLDALAKSVDLRVTEELRPELVRLGAVADGLSIEFASAGATWRTSLAANEERLSSLLGRIDDFNGRLVEQANQMDARMGQIDGVRQDLAMGFRKAKFLSAGLAAWTAALVADLESQRLFSSRENDQVAADSSLAAVHLLSLSTEVSDEFIAVMLQMATRHAGAISKDDLETINVTLRGLEEMDPSKSGIGQLLDRLREATTETAVQDAVERLHKLCVKKLGPGYAWTDRPLGD